MKLAHRRLKKAVPWAGVEAGATAGLGVVSLLTIMAVIGPEAFGRANLAIWTVSIIEAALGAGLYDAVLRARSVHTRLTDSIAWTRIGLGCLAMLLSLAVASVSDRIFGDSQLPQLMAVYSAAAVLNAISETPAALLTRKYRFATLARVSLAARAAGLVVGVGAAFAGTGSWSLILASLATSAVTATLYHRLRARTLPLRYDPKEMRGVLAFSAVVGLDGLLQAIAMRSALLFIGVFHGVTAVGYFSFALRILEEAAGMISRVGAKSVYPYFSEARRAQADLASAFMRANRLYLAVILPVIAGVGAIAAETIPAVFGAKWAPAVPLVQVLALALAVSAQANLAWPILRVLGRQRQLLAITALDAALGIIACLVTAHLPLGAVAVAWVAKSLAVQPVLMAVLMSSTRLTWSQVASYVRPGAIATLAMVGAVAAAETILPSAGPWVRVPGLVALGIAVYVVVLAVVDRQLVGLIRIYLSERWSVVTCRLALR